VAFELAALEWSHQLDTWIVVTGALSAVACALLGNFLVLRRMSMMGDAISHAVLPGLAVAFLLTGSRDSVTMFIGAGIVGVLTALFTEWVRSFGRVEESASMGVVFTALFAAGLILIVQGADKVDLDPGCVLYGDLVSVPMDLRTLFGWNVPRAVITLSIVLAIDVAFVLAFYKELKITSFDPALATSLGINARFMHYALMTLVAMTTVAAFESVGSILVIAMLIVPAATAHLLTERLSHMIFVSVGVASASAALGHVGALTVPPWFGFDDASTAGMIAVSAGTMFAAAMLLAPRHGLVSKWVHRARLAVQIAREDVLGVLYRFDELRSAGGASLPPPSADEVSTILAHTRGVNSLVRTMALSSMVRKGWATRDARSLRLTVAGRDAARSLVRSHRLWESYLSKHLHLPPDHLHPTAEKLEHVTTPAMRDRLSDATDAPQIDPQGRQIPPT
jgi:manganese/zinc/iron transport system permease protein